MLTFTAFGVPQPKGSARAFLPKGWTRPVVTSDNPRNKGWQAIMASAASAAIAQQPTFRILEEAAVLVATFHLPRPKAIKDRNVPHTTRPDLDKLVRSAKDALSQVAWLDDSLVVEVRARKVYAMPGAAPRAQITILTAAEMAARRMT